MKKITTLLFAICIGIAAFATDYTVEPTEAIPSYTIPIFLYSTSNYTITQQILLASEFLDNEHHLATEGDITSISFYYGAKTGGSYTAEPLTRNIQIFLMQVPAAGASAFNSYEIVAHKEYEYSPTDYVSLIKCDEDGNAGTSVFNGSFTTEQVTTAEGQKELKLNITPFHWDGSSNIVMTVVDMSNTLIPSNANSNLKFYISQTSNPRFWYYKFADTTDRTNKLKDGGLSGTYGDRWSANSTKNTLTDQTSGRSYVPKTTFTISTTIPVPTNLSASSITTSSATLSWNAAAGATGYNVRWGKTSSSLDHSQNNVAATSLAISDLDDGETYYFDVQTITAGGTSAWASEANFKTTAIVHEHNGISFNKWASTTSMPTSGNYYLNTDVTYDFYEGGYLNLAGDLNLCLNGHTINLGTKSINVTNGKTMTIFDPIGGGKITGFVPGQEGSYTYQGVISVENGGTLILREGEVENTYPDDDPEYKSIAIAVGGTLILSGAPVISSNEMDIYLPPTIPAKVITIESGKPLTNTTPYKVYKSSGVITSGWANMSGADPRNYFESANSARSICLNEGEASLRLLLNLSEFSLNSSIGTSSGQVADVNLTRSLTSSQYNTFCLPFALSDAQLQEFFGAGYDLEELTSSSLEGDVLSLEFERKYALEAGKPYLLQPSVNVTNPSFDGVTIAATSAGTTETSYIDFKGIYSPTSLTGGNKNLLFLGAGNELFWPSSTGNMNGFRAYFEVKGLAQQNAVKARIVYSQDAATALDQTESARHKAEKFIRNGQLIIERNGFEYNAQGQLMK